MSLNLRTSEASDPGAIEQDNIRLKSFAIGVERGNRLRHNPKTKEGLEIAEGRFPISDRRGYETKRITSFGLPGSGRAEKFTKYFSTGKPNVFWEYAIIDRYETPDSKPNRTFEKTLICVFPEDAKKIKTFERE